MDYQISSLDTDEFSHLFGLDDTSLAMAKRNTNDRYGKARLSLSRDLGRRRNWRIDIIAQLRASNCVITLPLVPRDLCSGERDSEAAHI